MPYDRSGTSMEESAMYFPQKLRRRNPAMGRMGYVDNMNMAGLGDVIDPLEQLAIQGYTIDSSGNVVPLGTVDYGYSGGSTGSTDTTATAPTGSQLQTVLQTINSLIQAGSTLAAQQSLNTLNMQRARQGLPPITLSSLPAAQAAQGQSNLMLFGLLGLAAITLLKK